MGSGTEHGGGKGKKEERIAMLEKELNALKASRSKKGAKGAIL
jgi:hypothetical protein